MLSCKISGVQILIDLITDAPREVQGLAAANLANMAKSSLGRNIMKRYGGIQRLVRRISIEKTDNSHLKDRFWVISCSTLKQLDEAKKD